MNRTYRLTFWLVCAPLASLAAACSSPASPEPLAAGGANAGNGNGVGGGPAVGGAASGGTPGSSGGASGAPATGGSSGAGAGAPGAGKAGTGTGGLDGAGGALGVGGNPAGGLAGASGGGGAEAGSVGLGGSGTGGQSGAAGAAGAAGMPTVERPGLVTSGPGAYWQVGTLTPADGGGQPAVTVNAGTMYQEWLGFGGTFNEAGWDALGELSQAERDRAIRLLFSPSEGANFKWGRVPIGASDYAIDRYTLNENAGDYDMVQFSIERDRQRLIPFIKAAQAVKSDIRFWASPWTPPTWMKDPPEMDATDVGTNGQGATYESFMRTDEQTLNAFALYLARFVEEYALEGIPIDGVYPQNEPDYATRYPSCRWAAGLMGTFVGSYLGPTFADRGLDTDIWFGTLSNNDNTIYQGHIGGLMGAAEDYVVGVGLQWNTIGHTGELANRGYLVMQTEHRCGNYPFTVQGAPPFNPDQPQNDHAYAIESWGYLHDWLEAGVNSYSAWNMVLDTVGKNLDAQRPWPQNALLVVDRATDQLIETPVYYVFRHLSYFVDPGAVRVAATGGDAIAFQNPDGTLVAVVFNSGNQAAETTVSLGGSTFQVQIPGQGWATLSFKG